MGTPRLDVDRLQDAPRRSVASGEDRATAGRDGATGPIPILAGWLREAHDAGVPTPDAMTFVTASADGQPSARVVSLKRLEPDALVFTTALWTRKAAELEDNPQVAAVFYWPSLGRQVQVLGRATVADRDLAEELFAERPRAHQLQTHVSRQGEPIDDLDAVREQLATLERQTAGTPIACPAEWGAVRVVPTSVEFWDERADRLHDRLLYTRTVDGWSQGRLAP